jgi:flagellar biosynthetic protein FlhB
MAGEKTEAPTPKKKKEARKKGQIARSPELVKWAGLMVATWLVPLTVRRTSTLVTELATRIPAIAAEPSPEAALSMLGSGLAGVITAILPLALGLLAVGVVGNLAQGGLFVSGSLLKPKFNRLNPAKGIKRLMSPQGLWQSAKVLIKVAVLALVCWGPLFAVTKELVAMGQPSLMAMGRTIAGTSMHVARNLAGAGLVLAAFDYVIMRRKHMKQLRMTKQEVKDEHRQSEGDPMVKGQIRQRQVAISRNRMIAAVGDASVVVVNPVHVAVALKYDPVKGAPRVVAKGKGEVAARIRAEAEKHDVPVVRDIPLARAIHGACDLNQEIPADLYEAVARVLAFVFGLGKRATLGGILSLPGRAFA